jgi:hypothetical protein
MSDLTSAKDDVAVTEAAATCDVCGTPKKPPGKRRRFGCPAVGLCTLNQVDP